MSYHVLRRHLSMPGLLSSVRKTFATVRYRECSLCDCLMAGLAALAKSRRKVTPDGLPVHSMTSLLADLATYTLNEVVLPAHRDHAFTTTPEPTGLQARAFELLEIRVDKGVAM